MSRTANNNLHTFGQKRSRLHRSNIRPATCAVHSYDVTTNKSYKI